MKEKGDRLSRWFRRKRKKIIVETKQTGTKGSLRDYVSFCVAAGNPVSPDGTKRLT